MIVSMTIKIQLSKEELLEFGESHGRPVRAEVAEISIQKASKKISVDEIKKDWLGRALDLARSNREIKSASLQAAKAL